MIASSVSRQRYREYTQFLRDNAERINMSIAPSRLGHLREQVNAERQKFLTWQVVWMLIALVGALPLLMLAAAQFGIPLPGPLEARADTLHFQLTAQDSAAALFMVVFSSIMSLLAAAIAYAPILAYSSAIGDLEYAHRALREVEKA